MRIKRRSAAVMTALTFGLAVALTATPASAGNGDPHLCQSGEVCEYENLNFNANNTNHIEQWTGNDYTYLDNYWYDGTSSSYSNDIMNDELSSIKNHGTSCTVWVWSDTNYAGRNSFWTIGFDDGNVGDNILGDNSASSHHWCTSR
jgi:hypothetical protein